MKKVLYGVVEEKYAAIGQTRKWYGIAAYDYEQGSNSTIIASVHDVTDDLKKITKLVDQCNELMLSVDHLADVVEDFLAQ